MTPKPLAQTKSFRTEPGATATHAIREEKWGVGTPHWTFFGGITNVGGETIGHTKRLGFRVQPYDVDLMGIQSYLHAWDMLKYDLPLCQLSGLGAGFYPNRRYWVGACKKLNTYNASGSIGSWPG